jgi:hypothetical protein
MTTSKNWPQPTKISLSPKSENSQRENAAFFFQSELKCAENSLRPRAKKATK